MKLSAPMEEKPSNSAQASPSMTGETTAHSSMDGDRSSYRQWVI